VDKYQNQGFIPQNEVPVHKYRTLLVYAIHSKAFCWKVRWWLGMHIPGSSGVWCLQKRVSCTRRVKLSFTTKVKAAELQSNYKILKYHIVYSIGLYFCVQTTHDNTVRKHLANSTAQAFAKLVKGDDSSWDIQLLTFCSPCHPVWHIKLTTVKFISTTWYIHAYNPRAICCINMKLRFSYSLSPMV